MKSGYNDEELLEERKINNSVPIFEQETHIYFMRDEEIAHIYTSDSTQITKYDNLCKEKDSMYELVEDTGRGKSYICQDKTLISPRKKKRKPTPLTEEQKQQRTENLRKAREKK